MTYWISYWSPSPPTVEYPPPLLNPHNPSHRPPINPSDPVQILRRHHLSHEGERDPQRSKRIGSVPLKRPIDTIGPSHLHHLRLIYLNTTLRLLQLQLLLLLYSMTQIIMNRIKQYLLLNLNLRLHCLLCSSRRESYESVGLDSAQIVRVIRN